MEPLNIGHFGTNITLANVPMVSSLGGSKCIENIGMISFGTLSCVLCIKVYYTVSLFGRDHYQRFHCRMSVCVHVFECASLLCLFAIV